MFRRRFVPPGILYPVVCPERQRLWDEYNEALNAFSRCVDVLSASIDDADFHDKVRSCGDANQLCKIARTAWEEHLKQHRCD